MFVSMAGPAFSPLCRLRSTYCIRLRHAIARSLSSPWTQETKDEASPQNQKKRRNPHSPTSDKGSCVAYSQNIIPIKVSHKSLPGVFTMKKSILSALRAYVLMAIGAQAYRSSENPTFARQPHLSSLSQPRTKRISYDLGLGKNPPVVKHKSRNQELLEGGVFEEHRNTYQAVEFLKEHQPTRDYPSPLDEVIPAPLKTQVSTNDMESKSHSKLSSKMPRPRRNGKPTVQPKRALEDILIILDETKDVLEAEIPTMIMPSTHQLDVNSIWVEMLLHDQQKA